MSRLLFRRINPSLEFMRFKTKIFPIVSNKHENIWILVPTVGQKRFINSTLSLFKTSNLEEEVFTNKKEKPRRKPKQTEWGVIDVYRFITLEQLSSVLEKPLEELQEAALYCNIDNIDAKAEIENIDVIKQIVSKFGYRIRIIAHPCSEKAIEKDRDVYPRPPAPIENLKPRPPVVTVMGHVDHGKTTLLDTLRGACVAESEAGGITQHIGAFTVELENGERVTFLDTPGHAAFSSMRARGAFCTDIIVLVVAAEDGVMPQTKEVLNLAREGQVPFVVAINKIDAPGANIEKTKKDLLGMGVNLEGHGGDVICVCISALKGINLDELADAITTQATLMDLKSEYCGLVEGIIIESKTDPRRGKLATIIVTRGTLRKGCILVAGTAHAKVRGMFDYNNQPIELATPGTPAEILGWREIPDAGDQVLEVESEKKANSVIHYRQQKAAGEKAINDLDEINKKRMAQDALYKERRTLKQSERYKLDMTTKEPIDLRPKFNVIVKADVHGSMEAILDVLDTYDSSDACKLSIVHYGVGPVVEGDMELAKTFNAVIYSFSLPLLKKKPNDIVIKEFNIIYRLIEDVIQEINNRLPEVEVEDVVGEAEVLQLFHINEKNKKIPVIGCRCTKGQLKKNLKVKLMRDDECIYDGEIKSMRHLKNEVSSIKKETECGIQLADRTIEPAVGDKIVNYIMVNQKQIIDWSPGF